MTDEETAAGDWRAAMIAQIRTWIHEADPAIVEEVKWRKASNPDGVPAWSRGGLVCTGETYRDKVKVTFAHGAALDDPDGLFNAGLDGGTRRAIDIGPGAAPDAESFRALIVAAVARNLRG